jgi:hypothetical protein
MKDQFVDNAVHFDIKHHQTYIHDHATHAKEIIEGYRQAHGFNDDDH